MAYLGFCPPGVVFPYAGSTAPEGWLLCNGAAVSRTTYASLFAAISTAHGTGDGSTTFNIPDYRGRFLRGTDTMGSAANRDPDKASRTASGTGGLAGDNVGSIQLNATKANGMSVSTSNFTPAGSTTLTGSGHGHDNIYSANFNVGGDANFYIGGGGTASGLSTGSGGSTQSSMPLRAATTGSGHTHGFAGTAGAVSTSLGAGDNETRPININVNYIIKI